MSPECHPLFIEPPRSARLATESRAFLDASFSQPSVVFFHRNQQLVARIRCMRAVSLMCKPKEGVDNFIVVFAPPSIEDLACDGVPKIKVVSSHHLPALRW